MLHESYSPFLIILSFLIAVISSYTTLILVDRKSHKNRPKKSIWLFMGSLIMGIGIFSMHFIAILASHVDSPLTETYNPFLLFLSLLSAIILSYAGFYILYSQPLTKRRACQSGLSIGIGIILLHYIASIAISEPVQIKFMSPNFIVSILISLVFSSTAIIMFTHTKRNSFISNGRNVLSAGILGTTIFLVHNVGGKATHLINHEHDEITTGIDTLTLGFIISFTTLFIMAVALFFAFLDYLSLQREKQLLKQIRESEKHYRRLVEDSPDPLIVMDGQKILFVNESCLKLVNVSSKMDLIGKSIMDFLHPDFKEIVLKRMQSIREGRKVGSMEQKIVAPNGSTIDVEVSPVGVIYKGKPAFQIVIRDITEQKRLRRELEESQQKYKSLFDHNPDAVYSMNPNGYFIDLNPSVGTILGYTREEMLRMDFNSVVAPDYLPLVSENFQKALEGKPQTYEFVCMHKNGKAVPLYGTKIPIVVDGKVIGVFGICKDISKEKEALKRIETLAYTDQLTSLPNRTWFYKNLQENLQRAKERKQSVAILILDFDGFKGVNDTLGHHAGDLFLQEVSVRLKGSLRANDNISRLGGDEFIVLLENVTKENVTELANRLLQDMNQPILIYGHELIVTLSIGISMFYDCDDNAETLIQKADIAMYEVKEQGKNNYQFFNEKLQAKKTRKIQIKNALYTAIERNEFKLFYQPQVDIQTGKWVGLEALLRWNPSFGNVQPSEFIPIAEETGLIVSIGEWVVREACGQIKEWERQGFYKIPLSVNISARQFQNSLFAWKVKKIIEEEKIDPQYLEIEITESVMLNVKESSQIIQDLKEMGIRFAIDDFGTGYSSLSVVANFEFDTLKIDKSFIDVDNDHKMYVLKAILSAANNPRTRIIVEGIETKSQVDLLKEYNVIGQGYYFSRPLPPYQLEQIWK